MEQEKYLQERLDDQIDWYDKKSSANQKWFKLLQIISIMAATTIPFLSGYITEPETSFTLKVTIGLLGLLVAAITAILGLYKFQENWIQFRSTCESLKHEKYLYLTNSEPYHLDQPFKLLVQRVESIISKENSNWSSYIDQPQKRDE